VSTGGVVSVTIASMSSEPFDVFLFRLISRRSLALKHGAE